MVRKKIDNRIRLLIENGVAQGHRSLFVVVGDKGRDQVVLLHHMLSKASVKARPTVLWCYKKELGFSSHRKKKMKQLQKKINAGKLDVNEDDPFELFIASTNIRYSYYHETHKILGNTYGMCILQDFEALTPNLLARTIETVEGGGAIIVLLKSVTSLKQLFTMTMDVHTRYRTEAHQDVVNRFNERLILSLASNKSCIVLDDQLNILPLSSHVRNLEKVTDKAGVSDYEEELSELKTSLQDTQPVGSLVGCCRTRDQAKALLKFVEAISEKTLRSTVSLTAARGRGKSAALGLAIAAAVGFGYSNIFVTSPSPENLHTLFDFVFKGFDALKYEEHLDYELIQSTNPDFNKAVVRVNIFHDHRQTIQYIHPADAAKLSQAELVVIDEAAAIPLPLVKQLLGPYLVFMASTINGYEGTGRSLSLKLLEQLRQQSSLTSVTAGKGDAVQAAGRTLHECTLQESIRYRSGDACEVWLNSLLCLDANTTNSGGGTPLPQDCSLYYINRDTLFSYHSASEAFLHRLMALFVASHYKNSPNDLQLLSDAPAHHIFCLLGPMSPESSALPEILCVVQVCLEGEISKGSIMAGLSRGQRASGDLIPWTMAQQFQDDNFPQLSGARIVRIATHPEYQRMGYGSRALQLLQSYYQGELVGVGEGEAPVITQVEEEDVGLLEETLTPRRNLPPLLLELGERPPERLHYIGTSFGLTANLLRFWKKAGFTPTYLRQTANDLTGEHTTIMLKILDHDSSSAWLPAYWTDFRRRLLSLLGYQLRSLAPSLALSLLQNKSTKLPSTLISSSQLSAHLTHYDVARLELYSNNMADYHLVTDLLPPLARLVFTQQLGDLHLSAVQQALLTGLGLQHKTVDDLATELELPASQLLGLFNRCVRKLSTTLKQVLEGGIEQQIKSAQLENGGDKLGAPLPDLGTELQEAVEELETKQKKTKEKNKEIFMSQDLSQYAIKGSDKEWGKALGDTKKGKNVISVKTGEKRTSEMTADPKDLENLEPGKKKKKKKNKEKH